MIWKPKEKDLTLLEAVHLATKELAPYWYKSSPRIAGVRTPETVSIFALDQEFLKFPWLVLFVDFTDYSGAAAIVYAQEWYNRYNVHHLGTLVVFLPVYDFMRDSVPIWKLMEERSIPFPMTIDVEEALAAAFSMTVSPKVTLFDNGKHYFDFDGSDNFLNTEVNIQIFLRLKDPGLPLLPFFVPVERIVWDVGRVEFGYSPKLNALSSFLIPEFIPQPESLAKTGNFMTIRPKALDEGQLFLSGKWKQEKEKIITQDLSAMIGFRSPGRHVALVVESLSKGKTIPIVAVELRGVTALEAFVDEQMTVDESGQYVLKVYGPGMYRILKNLPEDVREITLHFINCDQAPVAVYGVRFGD